MWRLGRYWSTLVASMLLPAACATSAHRMVARSITPPQWTDVVHCVTLHARTNETWVDESDNTVRVGRNLLSGGLEEILFVREPTGLPTFTVSSRTRMHDPRVAWRAPLDGPSQETRRLRQQLDAQCLSPYPIADSTSTE